MCVCVCACVCARMRVHVCMSMCDDVNFNVKFVDCSCGQSVDGSAMSGMKTLHCHCKWFHFNVILSRYVQRETSLAASAAVS